MVSTKLVQRPSLRPSSRDLVSLLKEIEAAGRTCEIRLQTELGRGIVWVRGGRVIDAQVANATGHAAIFRLLAMSGEVDVYYQPVHRKAVIKEPLKALLEARARRAAEWERLAELVPELDSVPAIDRTVLDAYRAELADIEFVLLGLVDRRRSILDVIDASGLDAVAALERIASYFETGLLTVASRGVSRFPPEAED